MTTEKILSIEEVTNHAIKESDDDYEWEETYEGYVIRTDRQEIFLLIGNERNCCESWGYLMTPDAVKDFVGATLLNVVNVPLSAVMKEEDTEEEEDNDSDRFKRSIFINIETDRGTLQFTAYNEHNGYYGHEVKIISTQYTHEKCL